MFKQDFPIFQNHPDLIYLDNAATAQKPQRVLDAMHAYYTQFCANVHRGLYNLSELTDDAYEAARQTVATFLNLPSPNQIIFTKNTTEAINLARYSYLEHTLTEGDTILLTILEHHSNFLPWHDLATKKKLNLKIVELDENQNLSADDIIAAIDPTVKFIAVSHVSNVLGIKIDIKRLLTHAKNLNIITLVDACQSVPHTPIDCTELGADFFTFSGHKVYGPTGIGVLAISPKMQNEMQPFLLGGGIVNSFSLEHTDYKDTPHRFEAGTPSIAAAIGLAEALSTLTDYHLPTVEQHISTLCAYAYQQLQTVPNLHILGPQSPNLRTSNLSFTIDNIHPHDIAQILAEKQICVRAGSFCAQPLFQHLNIPAATRLSFGLYNSTDDIDQTVQTLKTVSNLL